MGDATSQSDSTVEVLSMQELFPLHDFGSWPEAFTASREQIYGDDRATPVTPPRPIGSGHPVASRLGGHPAQATAIATRCCATLKYMIETRQL